MPLRSRVASRRCRIRRRSGAITTFAAALRDNVRARAGRGILILTSNLFKDKLKDYEGQRIGASRGYKNAKGEKVLFQPSRSLPSFALSPPRSCAGVAPNPGLTCILVPLLENQFISRHFLSIHIDRLQLNGCKTATRQGFRSNPNYSHTTSSRPT